MGPIGERAFLTAQSIAFLEKTLHVSKDRKSTKFTSLRLLNKAASLVEMTLHLSRHMAMEGHSAGMIVNLSLWTYMVHNHEPLQSWSLGESAQRVYRITNTDGRSSQTPAWRLCLCIKHAVPSSCWCNLTSVCLLRLGPSLFLLGSQDYQVQRAHVYSYLCWHLSFSKQSLKVSPSLELFNFP